jgi:defect-in-organelle-trafficking protein DotA
MPALIFLFSVIAWLFAAIEAMFASPLIAIGLTNPEGHEVLGRVEQAVMLLVGVFLRPILTLMGLMLGIFFAHIAVDLYNGIFLRLIPIYLYTLKDSVLLNQELIRVFFASGLVVLYVYAMLVVIEQCYSMIYMIPDRVLRWIGGPQDSAGSGVGGALQSISAGLSQDTASAGQQTGGASSRAFSQDTSVKK